MPPRGDDPQRGQVAATEEGRDVHRHQDNQAGARRAEAGGQEGERPSWRRAVQARAAMPNEARSLLCAAPRRSGRHAGVQVWGGRGAHNAMDTTPKQGRTRLQTRALGAAVAAAALFALLPPRAPRLPTYTLEVTSRLSMGMPVSAADMAAAETQRAAHAAWHRTLQAGPPPTVGGGRAGAAAGARPPPTAAPQDRRAGTTPAVAPAGTRPSGPSPGEGAVPPPSHPLVTGGTLASGGGAPAHESPPALAQGPAGHMTLSGAWLGGRLPRARRDTTPAADRLAQMRAALQVTHVMAAGAYSAGYVADWARTRRRYEEACDMLDVPAFPVSFAPLAAFVVDLVVHRKREPRSVKSRLTSLRKAVRLGRLGWGLDEADEGLLGMVVRGLCKSYKGQGARGQKEPLRLIHIEALLRLAESEGWGPAERLQLLQVQLAHAAMMRTSEHTGMALLAGDVQFLSMHGNIVGVSLALRNSKTGKLSGAQVVSVGRRADKFDVVRPLFEYMQGAGLFDPQRARAPLFCKGIRDPVTGMGPPVSDNDFRGLINLLTQRIGLDSPKFGGHSPRRGAANDAFDAGVPLDVIMRQGRWKSIAWMLYRRSTTAVMKFMAAIQPQTEAETMSASAANAVMLGILKEASDMDAEGGDSCSETESSA